jgi:hypothetical protein
MIPTEVEMSAAKDGSRNKSQKHADDDAVVTSAPAANVGNLLTDLLSSVKKDVEQERQTKVESEAQKREHEAREAREREEARLRMAAQEKLIEENRLRNESLNKARVDSGDAKGDGVMATGQHLRPQPVAAVAAPAPIEVSKVAAMPSKGVNKLLAAAMVVLGVGIGFGGAFATQPEQKALFPDLERAANTTVAVVSKAVALETAIRGDLAKESGRVGQLEKSVKTMQANQAELEGKLAAMQAELDKAAAKDDDKGDSAPKRGTGRRNDSGTLPGLKTGIF